MAPENPFGLPDWQSAEGYPPGDAPITVWAWEFLRRSPAYRTFWAQDCAPYLEEIVTLGISSRMTVLGRNADGKRWPHLDKLRSLFGVDVPNAPHEPHPSIFLAEWIRSVSYDERRQKEYGAQGIHLAENEIAYIFDLSRPLKPQFERALKVAEELQADLGVPPDFRKRVEKYVTYLRILDALDAGEKPQDIADHLYPLVSSDLGRGDRRIETFRDHRDAAEKMRDGGYRQILTTTKNRK
jgi:hypothetical protein